MSNKIVLPPGYVPSGSSVDAYIQDEDGAYWDNESLDTFTAIGSIAAAAANEPLTEQGTTTQFEATFPSTITARTCRLSIRHRLGASPSYSDPEVAGGWRYWDGSNLHLVVGEVTRSVGVGSFTLTALNLIQGEAEDALETYHLDHLVAIGSSVPAVAAGTFFDQIMSDGTATYDRTTDSLQAIRDRGDAAWTGGGGGGSTLTDILDVIPVIPQQVDIGDTATWRIGFVLRNSLGALPTAGQITAGTITIARKAEGGTSWSTIVNGAAMSEDDGRIYYDATFTAAAGYQPGDSLRITLAGQAVTIDTVEHVITPPGGQIFFGRIAPKRSDLTSHIDANSTQLAAILEDTNELQTDWANGGRLDTILDARAAEATAAAIQAKTDTIPATPADETTIQATLSTIAGYVDTEVAAIKAVTDKVDTALELDGAVYRFTENSLELAPTGGGGGGGASDWTVVEKEQIRYILGIDGESSAPVAVPHLATADAVADIETDLAAVAANTTSILALAGTDGVVVAPASKTGYTLAGGSITAATFAAGAINAAALASDAVGEIQDGLSTLEAADVLAQAEAALAAYDPPTMAELTARTLAAADYATDAGQDAIAAAVAALNDLGSADITAALTAFGAATQAAVDARTIPSAEYATAAAVEALNDLSAAEVLAQATAALEAYDGPTLAELEARTLLAAEYATDASIAALNDLSGAEVKTQVDTALTDVKLDRLVAAAATADDVTDDSLIAQLASKSATATWSSYDHTTDSLEANRDNQAGADIQAIVDGVLEGIGQTSPVVVADAFVFRILRDGRAANIVELVASSDPHTLAFDFGDVLSPTQDLQGSIAVTLSPSVADQPTNFAFDGPRRRVHFDVADLTAGQVYTITVKSGTSDPQKVHGRGTLLVT